MCQEQVKSREESTCLEQHSCLSVLCSQERRGKEACPPGPDTFTNATILALSPPPSCPVPRGSEGSNAKWEHRLVR